MNIRLRFPLRRPFHVHDHWPLAGNSAELSFETDGSKVTAFIVTFRDQPVELAPRIETDPAGGSAHLHVSGRVEMEGQKLIRRFIDYASLYFSLDVDTESVEAEYIAVDDAERARIDLSSLKSSKQRPITQVPFDLLSQAYFAAESSDDPSFAARMLHLAREALLNEHYIDAFRYSFLLLEALYGDGKSRKRDLVQAFLGNKLFKDSVEQLIASLIRDPIDSRSPARVFVESFPTADALTSQLVGRRGFYFHGNLRHAASWHPDKQQEAAPIAEFCVRLAGHVAQNYAGPMFAADMNAKVMANAKRFGAIMTIQIKCDFIDRNNVPREGVLNINMAGTKPTSMLAVRAHIGFLEWAELNLGDATLISTVALDKASGAEIFQAHYLAKRNVSK